MTKRPPLLPRKAEKITDVRAFVEQTAERFPVITEYLKDPVGRGLREKPGKPEILDYDHSTRKL